MGQCYRWLLDHNVSADKVEELLEEEVKQRESTLATIAEEDVPHIEEGTWLVSWERGRAEVILRQKRAGTFLIRPRAGTPDESTAPYALSMV